MKKKLADLCNAIEEKKLPLIIIEMARSDDSRNAHDKENYRFD